MRELSESEQQQLEDRRSQFETFRAERMPVLTDFMDKLDLPDPALVLVEADNYLLALSAFMKSQYIDHDDHNWILTRIGYFVGEWLVQKFGGCWFLNEIPDTRYFLHYVVGEFSRLNDLNAMVDPFVVAEAFINSPCPRKLEDFLADIELELKAS